MINDTGGNLEQQELLVVKAQAGDQSAAAELYRMNHPFIFNYIRKRVRNTEEAEDLTSKVFVRSIEKLSQYSYRPGHGYLNWLVRIAHNLVVDEWRRGKRMTTWSEIPETYFGLEDSAEDLTMIKVDEEAFREYMDYCTPQQAEVIKLKYIHDMSNEQIADHLGTSVGAVKSMQHRAFDNIKKEMGYDGSP